MQFAIDYNAHRHVVLYFKKKRYVRNMNLVKMGAQVQKINKSNYAIGQRSSRLFLGEINW